MHGIGYSLGAQAIGIFGQAVTALTFQKVARITGLDPARPYYETLHPSAILNKEDAALVDVIHTNSGLVINVSKRKRSSYINTLYSKVFN